MSRATTITVKVELDLTVEVTQDDGGYNVWNVTHCDGMSLLPWAAQTAVMLNVLCFDAIESAVEEERG